MIVDILIRARLVGTVAARHLWAFVTCQCPDYPMPMFDPLIVMIIICISVDAFDPFNS